ncbi:MAG: two pore domain potassium channel family protein [Rhizobiales bacterium]|nr:two pore domain potassium channel family protein [Hyphomicrobiales bacterium]
MPAPDPVLETALGVFWLTLVILIHGIGIQKINGQFGNLWARVTIETPHWKINIILATVIASLTALHLIETMFWGLPIYALNLVPTWMDSYIFVLENYTTLGAGNVRLPHDWRLMGPIIAISGLFTFGWTTGVLVSTMTEFTQLNKQRSKGKLDGSGS